MIPSKRRNGYFLTGVLMAGGVLLSGPVAPQELQFMVEPRQLRDARQAGMWPDQMTVSHEMNPYYLHGDFDGDDRLDLAVWVSESASGLKGVAILLTSRDTVDIIGAGRGVLGPDRALNEEYWRVVPAGKVIEEAWRAIPELGIVAGEPFTFDHEAVSLGYVAKSEWALYFSNGRYYGIQLAD
jgi:hypothetical protein